MKRSRALLLTFALLCSFLLSGCEGLSPSAQSPVYSLDELPAYSGEPYVAVNGNQPFFTEEDQTTASYETYSPLDALGRCGAAWANVGVDLMPTEDRGSIGQVKPSGWQTVKYDIVDGKYLYNRCHLIGFQLTGENANEENLITGTRYLNVEGMLPFENLVADYVKETENHVLYRVTPIFEGEELVARGVLMEGLSVEDGGEGITFCVYAYNVQPGVIIDYATGESRLERGGPEFLRHRGQHGLCAQHQIQKVSPAHLFRRGGNVSRQPAGLVGDRQDLLDQGYSPCGLCNP